MENNKKKKRKGGKRKPYQTFYRQEASNYIIGAKAYYRDRWGRRREYKRATDFGIWDPWDTLHNGSSSIEFDTDGVQDLLNLAQNESKGMLKVMAKDKNLQKGMKDREYVRAFSKAFFKVMNSPLATYKTTKEIGTIKELIKVANPSKRAKQGLTYEKRFLQFLSSIKTEAQIDQLKKFIGSNKTLNEIGKTYAKKIYNM